MLDKSIDPFLSVLDEEENHRSHCQPEQGTADDIARIVLAEVRTGIAHKAGPDEK